MEYKDHPLVSIIVAAHNEEEYLGPCVVSLIEQTYENIEICITDDGSTDNTLALLRELQGLDDRVKIAHHEDCRGIVAAFNSAFALTSGDYIAVSCADDINDTRRISTSLEVLLSSQSDVLSSSMLQFHNDGRVLGPVHVYENGEDHFSLLGIFRGYGLLGGTLFFTRDVARHVYPVPERLHATDCWISALTYSHRWKHIHRNFISAYYRIHTQNDSVTPCMGFSDFKRRQLRDYRRRNTFFDIYLEYIGAQHLVVPEHIRAHLEHTQQVNRLVIDHQAHPKASNMPRLFRAYSHTKAWYKACLVTLGLTYLLYLRMKLVHFFRRWRTRTANNAARVPTGGVRFPSSASCSE